VNAISLTRSRLRASIHSSRETILGRSIEAFLETMLVIDNQLHYESIAVTVKRIAKK
jgi:hypothetical protein